MIRSMKNNPVVHATQGYRGNRLGDAVSKVTITDHFTKDYADVLVKHVIDAKLIDKRS